MESASPRPLALRVLTSLGRTLDGARRLAANALFLVLCVALVAAFLASGPKVPKGAALVVAIRGDLVEQLSRRSPRDLAAGLAGGGREETLLRDVLDALAGARDDGRIAAVSLEVDEMGGAGMTALEEVAEAIRAFRKSGKKVVAAADVFTQRPYYLAAQADEVLLHPSGALLLEGFGRYRAYYRDAIDRLGITWNVFRVGEYKSAVEPYLRSDMSREAREADAEWLGDLWRAYVAGVAKARRKSPEAVHAFVDGYPERLRAASGDAAKAALAEKLVDRLATRDEVRKRMIDLVGAEARTGSWKKVSMADYLEALGDDRPGAKGKGGTVAVVVAKGTIVDGTAGPGSVGGDSTAALVRELREDGDVKAVVLRVDSPGGSAFASEVIRRELELVREAKKPVVVSMGSVAASGGYWISTASDEIWASPETITGSIGIYGMFPTFEKPFARYLGVHVDGLGTTPWAGALRMDREMPREAAEAFQATIDHGYEEFLARVASARKLSRDEVDRVARGRVWSGADARERGLVDHLGGLPDAIASAARKAKLGDTYRVRVVEKERTFRERLLASFSTRAARLGAAVGMPLSPEPARPRGPAAAFLSALAEEAGRLSSWNDPAGLYAHCLCEVR